MLQGNGNIELCKVFKIARSCSPSLLPCLMLLLSFPLPLSPLTLPPLSLLHSEPLFYTLPFFSYSPLAGFIPTLKHTSEIPEILIGPLSFTTHHAEQPPRVHCPPYPRTGTTRLSISSASSPHLPHSPPCQIVLPRHSPLLS